MKVHIVPVRLEEEQYCRLTELCAKTGLSASEVIRSALDGVHLRERPSADMGKLYTEINRIGNNINQIARKVNVHTAISPGQQGHNPRPVRAIIGGQQAA